jgi:hypothetical protein
MSESTYPPVPRRLMDQAGGGELEPYYPTSPEAAAGETPAQTPPGPGFNRQEFIKSYAGLVARTWVDQTYLELLLASPAATLRKAGMPTPPGSTIRIVQAKVTGSGQVLDQVDAWVEGFQTGLFDLYLPQKPEDIDFAPGGAIMEPSRIGTADTLAVNQAVAEDYSCCCTPCCCCT